MKLERRVATAKRSHVEAIRSNNCSKMTIKSLKTQLARRRPPHHPN